MRTYSRRVRRRLRPTRVNVELTLALGHRGNRKRVERLMSEAGSRALPAPPPRLHVRDLQAEPYLDLADRDFVVEGPDEIWCTDITEHSTERREGLLRCGH